MKGFVRGVRLLIFFAIVFPRNSYAGGIEHLLFSPEGHYLNVKHGDPIPDGTLTIKSKVNSTCIEAPTEACIKWQLNLPVGENPNDLLPSIISALNLISNNSSLKVHFFYNGVNHYTGNLFGLEPDAFGNATINSAISGNYLISTITPPEIQFPPGVVSTSVKYIVPNISTKTGDIQWGGIFLNNQYEPGSDYRLDLIVAHEAMRLLGAAPSATRNAILFPSQAAQFQGALQLAKDDLIVLQDLYPNAPELQQKGSVSGEVINGDDGSKLYGVNVELIPLAKVPLFSQTAERKLADYGAFSRDEGKFKISNVAPGDYIIIFESLNSLPISSSLWDDWIYSLGSDFNFTTEFYDGAQREGNFEDANTFSPQLALAAAIVKVKAGEETTGVQLITNTANLSAPELHAAGSSNEQLPEWGDLSEKLAALKNSIVNPEDAEASSSGGGCNLKVNRERAFGPQDLGLFMMLLGALLLLKSARFNVKRVSKENSVVLDPTDL